MRIGKMLKLVRNQNIADTVRPVKSQADKELYKKGLKRISDFRIRTGQTGDDFMRDVYSVVMEYDFCKIPRILNPLHKRTKSIKFN